MPHKRKRKEERRDASLRCAENELIAQFGSNVLDIIYGYHNPHLRRHRSRIANTLWTISRFRCYSGCIFKNATPKLISYCNRNWVGCVSWMSRPHLCTDCTLKEYNEARSRYTDEMEIYSRFRDRRFKREIKPNWIQCGCGSRVFVKHIERHNKTDTHMFYERWKHHPSKYVWDNGVMVMNPRWAIRNSFECVNGTPD